MADVVAPLEELPTTTAALMTATLRSAHHLVMQSAERLTQKEFGKADALWAIRRASLDLRFLVARHGEEVFFFFFTRQLPLVRPLSARLQASVQATAEEVQGAAPQRPRQSTFKSGEQAIYRLKIPSFLLDNEDSAERAKHAPTGVRADQGVLFRLGKEGRSIVGIWNPERGVKAQVSYQRDGDSPQLLTSWQVEPFLELIETLRDFVSGDKTCTIEKDIDLPSDPSQMSDVHVTLYWFVEAFLAMESAQQQTAHSLSAAESLVLPRYGTASYFAEIALCVDPNGRFATADGPDLISLGMHLSVAREGGAVLARIGLDPPDFLFQGALRESFLESLQKSTPKPIRKLLGFDDDSEWSAFLDSARARAVVFRIARDGSTDQDAVVLPGTFAGRHRTLILRTQAVVDSRVEPPRVTLSRMMRMYDSDKGEQQTLDDETVIYFMRLASAFAGWLSVL